MNDRIQNNPSFKKIEKEIKGAKALKAIVSVLKPFSKTAREVYKSMEGLDDIEQQFKSVTQSPDEFNDFFSGAGWIAHESMNQDLVLKCIDLAKKNKINEAEKNLADYYTSEEMKWLLHRLKGIKEIGIRYNLIQLAYQDTLEKHFHSAIPLLLMVIDGSVNDIDKNKGFFTETTDLQAWDSIASHSSGLSKLRDVLNETRKKTNEEEIFLPYRNGILHGRDLNFANKYVAGKCWATLISISDWARAIKEGKKEKPEEEKEVNLKESLSGLKKSLIDYQKNKQRIEKDRVYIDNWKPRNLIIDIDFPKSGELGEYQNFTPERDFVKFIKNWEKKNYGLIAKQVSYWSKDVNIGKEAGKVRKILEGKIIKSFEILEIIDCSPAISEILSKLTIVSENKEYELEIKVRMIYNDENSNTMVLGQEGGEWKFAETSFFYKIECLI